MDKVLIVDSNAEFLKSLKDGLDKMHQFEVLIASDGEEAIDILSNAKVAVLSPTSIRPAWMVWSCWPT